MAPGEDRGKGGGGNGGGGGEEISWPARLASSSVALASLSGDWSHPAPRGPWATSGEDSFFFFFLGWANYGHGEGVDDRFAGGLNPPFLIILLLAFFFVCLFIYLFLSEVNFHFVL